MKSSHETDEDNLLLAMLHHPGASIERLRVETGWPSKSTVDRVMKRLVRDKFAEKKRGHYHLTRAGKKEAENARTPA